MLACCSIGDHALLQPLLLPDSTAHDNGDDLLHHQDQHPAGAGSGHSTAANKEWGVRSTQAAPDLTIQLGACVRAWMLRG